MRCAMRDIIKDSALVLAEKIRCGEIKIAEVLDAVYESEKQNKELNCSAASAHIAKARRYKNASMQANISRRSRACR